MTGPTGNNLRDLRVLLCALVSLEHEPRELRPAGGIPPGQELYIFCGVSPGRFASMLMLFDDGRSTMDS